MPLFTAAITALSVAASPFPYAASYAKTPEADGARTYSADFTRLAPAGVAGRPYGSFAGKVASSSEGYGRADTYVAVLTFTSFDNVDIEVTDRYLLTLGMSAAAGLSSSVADSYVPRLTFTVAALQKAGETTLPALSDSYVPVLTLATPAITWQATATDSYVPVVTLSTTGPVSSDAVVIADSYVPVLGMASLLDTVVSVVAKAGSDSYVVTLTMTGASATAGEVDIIRLTGRPFFVITLGEI